MTGKNPNYFPTVNWLTAQSAEQQATQQTVACLRCHPNDPTPQKIYFVSGTALCYNHAHSLGAPDEEV